LRQIPKNIIYILTIKIGAQLPKQQKIAKSLISIIKTYHCLLAVGCDLIGLALQFVQGP